MKRRAAAFTLVEVLVALAILAVALAAGFRSIAQSADGQPGGTGFDTDIGSWDL